MQERCVSASAALERLAEGNKLYINSAVGECDISPDKRMYTSKNGPSPFAVIVACSDSRVIPECIFSVGIGDLFVIRVAGNVVDNYQMGSIEYAASHLGCKLVVVLGHTGCGAVGAAHDNHSGYLKYIADEIKRAVGTETDSYKAGMLNVNQSVSKIKKLFEGVDDVRVVGAMYHTDSGVVDFCE